MTRVLLLLLVCFCSSLRAEYRWTGTEWQWVEPDRQPLPPTQQQGSGGGANFDDDYDDEDTGPYDKDDAGVDDDDDDDYYVNYDQKGKKGDAKDGKGSQLPAARPKGGNGNNNGQTLAPILSGGKGPGQDKSSRPGKEDKGLKGKKTPMPIDGKGKLDVSSGRRVEPPLQPQLPPASRGKGGAASFIQTDDEDLVDGSGEDSDPYWDGGSGGGAPFNTRNPTITETSPDIELDLEDDKKPPGGGKTWNVDSSWAGTAKDTRTPAPTTPAKTVGPASGPGLVDDQFDYGEDDDDDNDDEDDYADKNPVDDYDDDELSVNSNDDISIDEATISTTLRTPASPPAGGRFPTAATPVSSTTRTTAAPSATPAITTTTDAAAGPPEGADKSPDTPIISDMLPNNRPVSFFAQPGILAAVIGGAVVGLLCAILLVMFIVYRMRKKDEGSYILDEPTKRTLGGNSYTKTPNKEFYA